MLHQKLFLSVAEVESFRPIQSSISPAQQIDQQINRLEDAIRGRARRKMGQAMDEMFGHEDLSDLMGV